MITFYWIMEFAKVLLGYVFLMYLWPSVVFGRILRGRGRAFRFAFCVSGQIVLINTVVLLLGLFHILNPWVFRILFYGVFILALFYGIRLDENGKKTFRRLVTGTYGKKLFARRVLGAMGRGIRRTMAKLCASMKKHVCEYLLLGLIVVFGMIYFSYGAFRDYSYGFGDLYVHNEWIYGLTEGKIFSAGVYPEGMHCFVYGMHTLFGIRIYSCLLFLAGIHVSVFLVSAYLLLREVFRWRFTPLLVLTAFLTVDLMCIDEIFSMSRLQWTLPQEFGLFTQFLCAAFLVRYLRHAGRVTRKGKPTKYFWDENLAVFLLSLAASLAVHFYPTIMAFFLCCCFVLIFLRKVLRPSYFIPLAAATACGFLIAVIPMGGALLSGIPFQGSIGWAVSVIEGKEGAASGVGGEDLKETEEVQETKGTQETGGIGGTQETEGTQITEGIPQPSAPVEPLLQRLNKKVLTVYNHGYVTLYRPERAKWIAVSTLAAFALWLLCRLVLLAVRLVRGKGSVDTGGFDGYFSITLASVLFMCMYCAQDLGLPALIAGSRLCSTEQLLILAMMGVPLDAFFTAAAFFVGRKITAALSVLCMGGIYVGTMLTGTFHGYLYYELTRYNGAVLSACSIVETLPKWTYTVVSPTDEIYQVIQSGRHEELTKFSNMSQTDEYRLPTEYVFIFLEKKPLKYAQSHFFEGPDWLAWEKYASMYGPSGSQCPEISAAELTGEEDVEGIVFANHSKSYSNLETRTLVEASGIDWCREFERLYPGELKTYYEDEAFVCYYFRQNVSHLYQLGIRSQEGEQ